MLVALAGLVLPFAAGRRNWVATGSRQLVVAGNHPGASSGGAGGAGAGRACGRAKQPRASVRSIHLSLPLQATIELADYVADRQRLGLADLPHNFGVRRRQAATNESHDGSPHTPPVDASETCKSWVIANVPFDIRGWSVIIFGFDRHVNAS